MLSSGGRCAYERVEAANASGASLNPFHTHFVLVDDGARGASAWGTEQALRAALENEYAEVKGKPQALLVVQVTTARKRAHHIHTTRHVYRHAPPSEAVALRGGPRVDGRAAWAPSRLYCVPYATARPLSLSVRVAALPPPSLSACHHAAPRHLPPHSLTPRHPTSHHTPPRAAPPPTTRHLAPAPHALSPSRLSSAQVRPFWNGARGL
jgi:hypothetical protein